MIFNTMTIPEEGLKVLLFNPNTKTVACNKYDSVEYKKINEISFAPPRAIGEAKIISFKDNIKEKAAECIFQSMLTAIIDGNKSFDWIFVNLFVESKNYNFYFPWIGISTNNLENIQNLNLIRPCDRNSKWKKYFEDYKESIINNLIEGNLMDASNKTLEATELVRKNIKANDGIYIPYILTGQDLYYDRDASIKLIANSVSKFIKFDHKRYRALNAYYSPHQIAENICNYVLTNIKPKNIWDTCCGIRSLLIPFFNSSVEKIFASDIDKYTSASGTIIKDAFEPNWVIDDVFKDKEANNLIITNLPFGKDNFNKFYEKYVKQFQLRCIVICNCTDIPTDKPLPIVKAFETNSRRDWFPNQRGGRWEQGSLYVILDINPKAKPLDKIELDSFNPKNTRPKLLEIVKPENAIYPERMGGTMQSSKQMGLYLHPTKGEGDTTFFGRFLTEKLKKEILKIYPKSFKNDDKMQELGRIKTNLPPIIKSFNETWGKPK